MWGIRRKCVFYIIFNNTTKYLKIFSFFENNIFKKYLFFKKYFTCTKHGPSPIVFFYALKPLKQ